MSQIDHAWILFELVPQAGSDSCSHGPCNHLGHSVTLHLE
jgi:hypothetical protein